MCALCEVLNVAVCWTAMGYAQRKGVRVHEGNNVHKEEDCARGCVLDGNQVCVQRKQGVCVVQGLDHGSVLNSDQVCAEDGCVCARATMCTKRKGKERRQQIRV